MSGKIRKEDQKKKNTACIQILARYDAFKYGKYHHVYLFYLNCQESRWNVDKLKIKEKYHFKPILK